MYESSNDLANHLKELSGWEFDQVQGYSLGYLVRKLPGDAYIYKEPHGEMSSGEYTAMYHLTEIAPVAIVARMDVTPENAAAKLAIALFNNGVLTPEGRH